LSLHQVAYAAGDAWAGLVAHLEMEERLLVLPSSVKERIEERLEETRLNKLERRELKRKSMSEEVNVMIGTSVQLIAPPEESVVMAGSSSVFESPEKKIKGGFQDCKPRVKVYEIVKPAETEGWRAI
jgi:hypothetical protein